jgi:ppGpp synthetase/RelA/SpoT-type nucleotidyltranferase
MVWVTTSYSKGQITRAGKTLIDRDTSVENRIWALDVMSNWRAAQAYPMRALLMTLRRKAIEVDINAVVVQRHKRAPSIINKLRRFPKMELSRMQDISGCRAIVATVDQVEELNSIIQSSRTRNELHREYNYIAEPKDSGYRGIHLTYKYKGEKTEYNGYFVELQLRSKIQHAWATTVEIVDTFTDQALKSSKGSQDWQNFFRMASAEFARIEGRPMGKYASGKDTNAQLAKLAHQLSVIKRLKAFAVSAKYIIEKNDNDTNYFLLELAENTINITKYKLSEFDRATAAYLQKEKESKSDSATDVVLVAAESMYALQNAYPNYFADSTEFVQLMEKALAESV